MIHIENLLKEYGQSRILDIPELLLATGKINAIVGGNGAGKSTLLKILACLEKPTAGSVRSPYGRHEIVYCQQKPYMFFGSAKKNILFGVQSKGAVPDEAAWDKTIEKLKLRHLLEKNAKALSAGEMQRVSIARGLLTGPNLLLLDEPTANIDPESMREIEDIIRNYARNGKTVILASHNYQQALRLCAVRTRIENGRLAPPEVENIFEGTAEQINGECRVRLNNGPFIYAISRNVGRVRVSIPPTDVVLSTEELDSSIRNTFPGNILKMSETNGSIGLTAGIGVELKSFITRGSMEKMELGPGKKIFVSFKAASVKVF